MPTTKPVSYDEVLKKSPVFPSYFKLSPFPLLVLQHTNYKVMDANPKALEFFNLTGSEIKKKYLYTLAAPVDEDVKHWKTQLELHKGKPHFELDMPLYQKNNSSPLVTVFIQDISSPKFECFMAVWAADSNSTELIKNLKNQNRELSDQAKKMVDLNRKIVNSYESVKKQYKQLLEYQEENVKTERQKTIGEMIDVCHDKISKPLNRILDDIQKINDNEGKLNSSVVKRIKMIEESVENILRTIDKISDVKDIKKMRYIELSNF